MIEPSKSPWAYGVVMFEKKGGNSSFVLECSDNKGHIPNPPHGRNPLQAGGREVLHDVGFGLCVLALRRQDWEKTFLACELRFFQWKRMSFG